eukprot:Protomagalhaensia_wolfi_Nauph_80__1263@NODE_1746_length_1365_cov_4_788084_g1359_i0_p1_GENE_NODE_1746_length_1365_cov_4_788084_g1359_i0NODE_1746_length_1365_cov_4_788084_g1359_i0_p1_ORF_typecomplete_len414_score26_55_NODE_1746_length_1365_cov_4_788084_g1359_i0591300
MESDSLTYSYASLTSFAHFLHVSCFSGLDRHSRRISCTTKSRENYDTEGEEFVRRPRHSVGTDSIPAPQYVYDILLKVSQVSETLHFFNMSCWESGNHFLQVTMNINKSGERLGTKHIGLDEAGMFCSTILIRFTRHRMDRWEFTMPCGLDGISVSVVRVSGRLQKITTRTQESLMSLRSPFLTQGPVITDESQSLTPESLICLVGRSLVLEDFRKLGSLNSSWNYLLRSQAFWAHMAKRMDTPVDVADLRLSNDSVTAAFVGFKTKTEKSLLQFRQNRLRASVSDWELNPAEFNHHLDTKPLCRALLNTTFKVRRSELGKFQLDAVCSVSPIRVRLIVWDRQYLDSAKRNLDLSFGLTLDCGRVFARLLPLGLRPEASIEVPQTRSAMTSKEQQRRHSYQHLNTDSSNCILV